MLLLLKAFGRFPLVFNEFGSVSFKLLSWTTAYTISIFLLQLFTTGYTFTQFLFERISNSENFDDTLYWICMSVALLYNFTIPFTYWCEAQRNIEYFKMWYHFQEELGSDELELHLKKAVRIYSIFHLPVSLAVLIAEGYNFFDFRIMVPYLTATGSMLVSLLFWCVTLYELKLISNKLLRKIIADGCRDMRRYRILWLQLSNLISGFSYCVGLTGITASTLLFTAFILSTYGLLARLFEGALTDAFLGLVITSVICLSSQFITCDAAHRTTRAAGQQFSSKLLQLDFSKLNDCDKFEISLLLQTMAANPPEIHFLGFVTVDRKLCVSFIADTMTYLVVLIQFKTSALARSLVNAVRGS